MTIKYSVIIPIKNEASNITSLINEVSSVMNPMGQWELIYIDDGSTDQSLSILKGEQKNHPYLRIIVFDKNYGQSSAFDAGFRLARGDILITLDGDGQNDPKDIPKLLKKLNSCDLVCGWRKERHDPLYKKLISKIANKVRSRVCQDGIHDTGCSLKVFTKSGIDKIKLYHGMHRFLPALFKIEGLKISEIKVNHRNRSRGKSKYHFFNRLLGPIMDMWAVYWMRRRHLHYKIKEDIK